MKLKALRQEELRKQQELAAKLAENPEIAKVEKWKQHISTLKAMEFNLSNEALIQYCEIHNGNIQHIVNAILNS